MPAKILETKGVPVDSLEGYPGNARRGDVELIRESIRTNGMYRPIVVQKSTGRILAGNHTWLATKEEGIAEIQATFVECTDAEARKIVLIDNKANDVGGYNKDDLAGLLQDLDGDFDGTGFTNVDLSQLLDELAPPAGSDGGGGLKPPGRVSQGDTWILGDHRLLCGDATDLGDLGLLMAGDEARLVVTSPPYNQKLDGFKPSGMQKENPAWVERMASAYEDSLDEPEYQDQQVELLNNLMHVTTDDASVLYNHKNRYREREVLSPLRWLWRDDQPWKLRQEIIWDRQGSITLNAKMFMPCDERIYWLTCGDTFVFNDTADIKAYSTVWDIAPRAEAGVSAPFPLELPQRCVQACSVRGDIVLDPYMGSGTTILACEALGRRGYGVEINPEYCDVILARWEAMSGRKAHLEDS